MHNDMYLDLGIVRYPDGSLVQQLTLNALTDYEELWQVSGKTNQSDHNLRDNMNVSKNTKYNLQEEAMASSSSLPLQMNIFPWNTKHLEQKFRYCAGKTKNGHQGIWEQGYTLTSTSFSLPDYHHVVVLVSETWPKYWLVGNTSNHP